MLVMDSMRKPNATPESYQNLALPSSMGAKKNFHTSLDSLANSLNASESLSDDSHDSDSSNTDKNSFAAKCETYAQNGCGSICSWTKSENGSENSYEYVSAETAASGDKQKSDKTGRMETIPEEGAEPKVSVKEILARFENLRDKKEKKEKKAKESPKVEEESKKKKEEVIEKEIHIPKLSYLNQLQSVNVSRSVLKTKKRSSKVILYV